MVGNAISRGNVELEYVLDQRIAFRSMPDTLYDFFLRTREPIVIAGTHGKTTTTSMLAWTFQHAGKDPVHSWWAGLQKILASSFALRQGKHFIIEGDEYDTAFFQDKGPKFLHYFPQAVILTSVEFDHADIYDDLEAVKTAFKRLVNLVPRKGKIIAYDSDSQRGRMSCKGIYAGGALWFARRFVLAHHRLAFCPRTTWQVLREGEPWGNFEFALAGEYNVRTQPPQQPWRRITELSRMIAEALSSFRKRETTAGNQGPGGRYYHHRLFRPPPHRPLPPR